MHELSLVTSIADMVLGVIEREGASQLVSLRLELGVLSCARREALEMCFPLATRETKLEGARLEIVDTPLALSCTSCGARTERIEPDLVCDACGSDEVDVVGGRDLVIASLEVK